MKKKLVLILLILSLVNSVGFADIVSFEAGVMGDPTLNAGEYNYKEMIFITGEPIELVGTVKVPEIPTDKDTFTLSYTFELQNTAKNAAVTRSVKYDVVKTVEDKYKQTTYEYTISKLDESITIGGVSYNLDGFLYNKSILYDNTPAVDYFSGNIYLKRTYHINGDRVTNQGTVTVVTTTTKEDRLIGYDHYWGSAETVILNQKITGVVPNPAYNATDPTTEPTITWSGNVILKLSGVDQKRFEYLHTTPQSISFRGSYIQSEEKENVLQYTYDLPTVAANAPIDNSTRKKDEKNTSADQFIDGKSLITPKIKDIGGHWAEEDIMLLNSLQVFDDNSEFFGPDLPITRLEFARAISNAIADIPERTQADIIRSTRNTEDKIFKDILGTHEYYNYIEFVKNKGIMQGEFDYFLPDRVLKRSEVITILVNTLGLNSLAPAPPYKTIYKDDADIPNWAKDSIYVANEINLVTGYEDGTIRPNERVTKAEATRMIVKMIDHIKDNIKIDYREKIINKY